ncbi:MAG: hypothetical protein IT378_23330 [Sandaracinaceae bacterium]|nr:hypothetical protein [Sandaracinaceae bacterium]
MIETFERETQEKLSRGWPRVRELGRGRGDPIAAASKVLGAVDPPVRVAWTPASAAAYLRGAGASARGTPPEVAERMARASAIDGREASELAELWAGALHGPYLFQVEEAVLLFEALLGTERAFDVIASALVARGTKGGDPLELFFARARADAAQAILYYSGYLRLRHPDRRAATERLRDLAEGASPAMRDTAAVVLGDGKVARDAGFLCAAAFVEDDLEGVRALSAGERMYFSFCPRFVHLGGPSVLADFARRAREGVHPWVAARLAGAGVFRDPAMIDLMVVLAERKAHRKLALEQLAAHRDYALEHADRWAGARAETRSAIDEALRA